MPMIISYGRPGILAKIKTITVNTKESVMPGLRLAKIKTITVNTKESVMPGLRLGVLCLGNS